MLSTFDYVKPQSLNEAIQYLGNNEGTHVLAGGTDLMILLRKDIINAKHVMDIKGIRNWINSL